MNACKEIIFLLWINSDHAVDTIVHVCCTTDLCTLHWMKLGPAW